MPSFLKLADTSWGMFTRIETKHISSRVGGFAVKGLGFRV